MVKAGCMGIVNIEDELHDQLRKASKASYRDQRAGGFLDQDRHAL